MENPPKSIHSTANATGVELETAGGATNGSNSSSGVGCGSNLTPVTSGTTRAPVSSYGIVHVLRCIECGFESLIRHRFASHVPCANKRDSYMIYTCSKCSAYSTSQNLMQEHGELCHSDQSFTIEKRVEKFVKVTEANCTAVTTSNSSGPTQMSHSQCNSYKNFLPSTGTILAPPQQSCSNESPVSDEHNFAFAKVLSMPLAQTPLPPLSTTTQSGGPLQIGRSDDWMQNINSMASFLDLMNVFTSNVANRESESRKVSENRLESDFTSANQNEVPKGADDVVCPVCHQKWNDSSAGTGGNALEELAKHLALIHLFPFPVILNYLSKIALATTNSVGKNLTEMNTRLNPIPMVGSLALAHPLHTASVLSSNVPGDKRGSENQEWMLRGTNVKPTEPATSLGNNLRTLKREHHTSEPAVEQTNWDERNSKLSNKTHNSPSKSLDCPQCGRGCSSVTQLQQHLLQAHSEQLAAMSGLGRWPFTLAAPSILPALWPGLSRTGNPIRMDLQPSEQQPSTMPGSAGTPPPLAIGVTPFEQPSSVVSSSSSTSAAAAAAPFVNWQLAAAAAAATAAAFGMPFPAANNFGSLPRAALQLPTGGLELADASNFCSEPKRPKLQGLEGGMVGPATTNGMPNTATESMNLPFPCFQSTVNSTNTSDNSTPLSMETLKLPNSLWGPCLPPATTAAKFPDFACPTLLKPELMPNYPTLVPPFPFCDSLSMLPSLYASVQQQHQRTATSSSLNNLPVETFGINGPTSSQNDDQCDSNLDRRSGVMTTTFTYTNTTRRSSRSDQLDSERPDTNSDAIQGANVSRNRTNNSKAHDMTVKASRETTNASTTSSYPATSVLNTPNTTINMVNAAAAAAVETTTPESTTTTTATATSTTTSLVPYLENQTNSINGLVHNTLRKTRSDMKVIHRYLVQVKHDTRDIHQIPYYELDQYIQDFVLTAKKKDGHEYEPESLKAFVHSLERHLKHHDYPHSVLKGNAFTGTRAVLNQRLNELRALSRSGGSANTASSYTTAFGTNKRSPDEASMDASNNAVESGLSKRAQANKTLTTASLMQAGLLGKDNPQAILNSLWLVNRTQFNIGGTQRHRNLVWGQFQLVTDELGVKAIKFTPLFESAEVRYCRGYGGSKSNATDFTGGRSASGMLRNLTGSSLAKRQPLPFNCVELFELYASLRPIEARGVSEPFYLCPESTWEQTGNWFKTSAAGSQLLSRIPRLLGLKPSREPLQMEQTVSDSRDTPCPDLLREAGILTNGDRNCGSFTTHSQSALAKNLLDQSFPTSHLGPNMSAAHSSLGPNLFNLFPFMFNCSPEAGGSSIPNPYLIPGTAYTNFMMNSPASVYPTKFNPEVDGHSVKKFTENAAPSRNLREAVDELSQPNKPESCRAKQSSNEPIIRSPLSHTEPCSDGTPSPTDAENFSLSDASPRLSSMTATTEKLTCNPTQTKPACSPQLPCPTSSVTSTSHKDSGSFSNSLKIEDTHGTISSGASSVENVDRLNDSTQQPIESHSKMSVCSVSECDSTWSNEAINLAHCASEGSQST